VLMSALRICMYLTILLKTRGGHTAELWRI
jgi:hypothetical protein